ncbi:MAG: GNAT family N-acetyltransferase [Anaerolineales bacterium]|nr:GNAT family N-acetyltransferase [Anaerolineales bacterium]
MSAQALSIPQEFPSNLRRFDIRRDLNAVADLVELCFANSLDADGRLYIQQMRDAARSGPLLDLAASSGRTDLPLNGFVWQEGERVVGNLSLIAQRHAGQRLYLIANVSVHPEHRRRGIAEALTQAALQDLVARGRPKTWLQVDADNPAAVELYRKIGFRERMQRTSWRLLWQPSPNLPETHARPRARKTQDWARQQEWLDANYPADLRWQLPLEPVALQPGLRGSLERALSARQIEQWSAVQNGRLLGVLSWQSSAMEADHLWLAAPPKSEAAALPALVAEAAQRLYSYRPLSLNYPAGRAVEALEQCGFRAVRTLIWMDYPWKE